MKEKDLDKHLDNLIIDGLIKEAEQDNADFEAAMRKMSDEEFKELIYEPQDAYIVECASNMAASFSPADTDISEEHRPLTRPFVAKKSEPAYNGENRASEMAASSIAADTDISEEHRPPFQPIVEKKSKWQVFRPWITSAVAAAAVVLIVLIPSVNVMNGKLCDSALYASNSYITSSRSAIEINGLNDDQLKAKLPKLEKRYKACIKEDGKFTYYTDDLKEAGWDLTLVYLKLHKKGDAVKVLKVLSAQFNGTPFGDHCRKMLDQL